MHKEEDDSGLAWSANQKHQYQFLRGIDGAFLIFPFQCDICWFRNLENRDPLETSLVDMRLMKYIRRVNLDGIWSRSESTVGSVKRSLIQLISCWREIGLTVKLPELGPWELEDKVGFRLALGQLRYSQRQGNNEVTHLQYDTIRKLRTALGHVFEASAGGVTTNLHMGFRSLKGEAFRANQVPMESRWYALFNRGLLLRMGRQTQTDLGLDIRILHVILENIKEEVREEEGNYVRVRQLLMCGTFLIVSFVLALRGHEGFMMDAFGLHKYLEKGLEEEDDLKHVVIPLLGKFKNEDGERFHLLVSVSVTGTGLNVREWVEWWAYVLKREGRTNGPAFCDLNGEVMMSRDVDCEFHNQLERVQGERPDLMEKDLDVRDRYSIYRSLRRGSTARAIDRKVPTPVLDLHNRWRTREMLKGQRGRSSMRDYYTDLVLVLDSRLEYSRNL